MSHNLQYVFVYVCFILSWLEFHQDLVRCAGHAVARDALSPEKSPEFRNPRPHSGLGAFASGIPGVRASKSGIPKKSPEYTQKSPEIRTFYPNILLYLAHAIQFPHI